MEPHTYPIVGAAERVQCGSDVEEEGGRRSLVRVALGHLSLIEIDHVADLCSTPVYDPIVPVKGQLVPEPAHHSGLGRQVSRPATEARKPRSLAFALVQTFPFEHLAPGAFVDGVVDAHHGGHVLLARVPPLASHGVVEHLRRGIEPGLLLVGLVGAAGRGGGLGDRRSIPIGGEGKALAGSRLLIGLHGHLVFGIDRLVSTGT